MSSTTMVLFILCCEAVGILSGVLAGTSNSTWYRKLRKPKWNPPSLLFGPVWTLLYALMAIAAYIVWISPASLFRAVALALFALQLALNFLWTPLFFKLHWLRAASIEIIFLLVTIAASCRVFWAVNHAASILMMPYLLWVGFATALSSKIWRLNR